MNLSCFLTTRFEALHILHFVTDNRFSCYLYMIQAQYYDGDDK